jgi:NFU1 iron-sulfur cluster scaffold homolog, mitochondrial
MSEVTESKTMEEQIKQVIIDDINPYLAMHAGSCDFVSYEEGVVTIRLQGGCSGCPSSQITLFNGITPILKEKLPEIEEVLLD